MYVCMSFMRSNTVRPIAMKFGQVVVDAPGKVFVKKN